jgi:hypothetical protein
VVWQLKLTSTSKDGSQVIFQLPVKNATGRTPTCECSKKIMVNNAEFVSGLLQSSNGKEIEAFTKELAYVITAVKLKTYVKCVH